MWTLGATALLYGLFYAFWAVLIQYVSKEPFLLALVWTVMEWQKSNGYFAFPWGLLPYTVQNIPVLIQTADTAGVYGLSFLLALCNAALVRLIRLSPKGNAKKVLFTPVNAAILFLLGWTLCYGAWCLKHPVPILRKIPMVLVQHNIDQYRYAKEALSRAIDLSRQGTASIRARGGEPALIVWSETLLTMPFKGGDYFQDHPLIPFLEESRIPVITGAPLVLLAEPQDGKPGDGRPPELANGAILVQRGRIVSSYAKRQLIPFAETIPFGTKKWMLSLMEKFVGFSSAWKAGKEVVVMEVPGLRFGTPICFEDAFAGICRDFIKEGADILINLTNDSWSGSVSAEIQHLAAARFRSVENRRTIVRSTNSGCTVVVDAEGLITGQLPPFSADYLALDVPVQQRRATVYYLLGDWFPFLCAALFAVYLIRNRSL